MNGTVVISGGSGGIGSETARRVVAAGGTVALVARDAQRLERVAAEVGATAVAADVLDEAGFVAALDRIERETGEIDGYVHSVGSIFLKPLHTLSLADWNAALEINATSAFLALRAILPRMIRRKRGSIVLFSTVAVGTGLANHETIAAAKGAIEGLVRSAAISYARFGIRVNAVAPALTKTELSRSLWENDAMLEASIALHPLGRIGTPADIAAAAAFLLSDDAAWASGQILGIDGALSAGILPPRRAVLTKP